MAGLPCCFHICDGASGGAFGAVETEIDEVLRDINGPIFGKVAEMIHDIEDGRRVNERANLDELAAFVAALPAA